MTGTLPTQNPASASSTMPDVIPLTVTIRDFKPFDPATKTGHKDFQMDPAPVEQALFPVSGGFGVVKGIVLPTLGPDNKPVYAGNPKTAWTNGKEWFDKWFRDDSAKQTMTLYLRKLPNSSVYQFDSDVDYKVANPALFAKPGLQPGEVDFAPRKGFFPIDGQLLGNFDGPYPADYTGAKHNYHFTLEASGKFTYRGTEVFSFRGDDDLWVFIDRKLVIDMGGVHKRSDQIDPQRTSDRQQLVTSIDLSNPVKVKQELGLDVGKDYEFHLFYAERRTTDANFKIDTSIVVEKLPTACIKATKNLAQKVEQTPGEYVVELTDGVAPAGGLTVGYEVQNTSTGALPGVDVHSLPGAVTIPTGQKVSAPIPVRPLASQQVNASKPLNVALKADPKYQHDKTPATVTVVDRAPITPPPVIPIALPTAHISPSGAAKKSPRRDGFFIISCPDKPLNQAVTITYQIIPHATANATMGRDYEAIAGLDPATMTGTVTIPANQTTSAPIMVVPRAGGFGVARTTHVVAQILPNSTYNIGISPATVAILVGPSEQP